MFSPLIRLEAQMVELDALVSDPKLYDDSKRAAKVVEEKAKVESKLEAVKGMTSELRSWREMHGERTMHGVSSNGMQGPPAGSELHGTKAPFVENRTCHFLVTSSGKEPDVCLCCRPRLFLPRKG